MSRRKAKKRSSDTERERRRSDRQQSMNLVSYCSMKGAKVYSTLGLAETLDISPTGMRIATREPLVLGAMLEFDLKLGDQIHTLKGQVVRGSIRDDDRFELGVNFVNVTPLVREAVRHYLTWQGHFKGVPKRGAMTGVFEGHQLADLIQMLGVGQKTGLLRIMTDYSDAFFGVMAFNDGKVVSATTSHGLKGGEAAYELALARRGSFEYRPELPAGLIQDMLLSADAVLMEALKRGDEDRATAPPPKPPSERLPAQSPGSDVSQVVERLESDLDHLDGDDEADEDTPTRD